MCKSSNGRSTKARNNRTERREPSPLEILRAEPQQINPAILLAEELMRRDLSQSFNFDETERVRATLEYSEKEIETLANHLAAFNKLAASPGLKIPTGF